MRYAANQIQENDFQLDRVSQWCGNALGHRGVGRRPRIEPLVAEIKFQTRLAFGIRLPRGLDRFG
jgi:hypothetical protein